MTVVAGVDGCRSGWIVCLHCLDTRDTQLMHVKAFHEILQLTMPVKVVAVDMPIGPPDTTHRRECETLVRRMLGDRRASVFSTPARAVLEACGPELVEARRGSTTQARRAAISRVYRKALKINRSVLGTGLSLQSFHIIPKILEVDQCLGTSSQSTTIIETHPELIFRVLAGGTSLGSSKHVEAGIGRRLEILAQNGHAGIEASWAKLKEKLSLHTAHASLDDAIDAAACCVTAEMHALGNTESFPPANVTNACGRPMRIWAPKACTATPVAPT
jgi:predicted RNase H-like nuclease